MPPEEKEPQNQRPTASKKAGKGVKVKGATKQARLADALRANLRKRKQARHNSGDNNSGDQE